MAPLPAYVRNGRRNQRRKNWRAALFRKQNGKCYWCPTKMVLIEGYVKKPPMNMATLDHLDDRFSPDRGKYGYGVVRSVCACWKCNNERGRESVAAQPLIELQKRSMHRRHDATGLSAGPPA